MADPTAEFFDALGKRGHEPLLEKASGTLRFDLARRGKADHWFVSVGKGDIEVSPANATADCVVRMDKALFDAVASGKRNAVAALLRGEIGVEGDIELLMLFDRLFPGPPGARGPLYSTATAGGRHE